jgi:hypothetical protein
MTRRYATRSLAILTTVALPACGDDGTGTPDTDPTLTPTLTQVSTSTGIEGTTEPTPTEGSATTSIVSGESATGTGTTVDLSATDTTTPTSVSTDTTDTDPVTTVDPDTTNSSGSSSGESSSTGDEPCPDGTIVCEGTEKKVCDGLGGFKDVEACVGFCLEGVGCVPCEPNSFNCDGDTVQQCDAQGGGYNDVTTCDAVQGQACDPDAGGCSGACAAGSLGTSYIGCDYYPTVTAGLQETNPWVFNFAVVVANTSAQNTNVTITRGGNMVATDMVGPNTAKVIQLPYVPQLSISPIATQGPTVLLADGAYRLRSDQPVTVYQYEPLEYKVGNSFSFTNDASLLLPVNTWTRQLLRVASRNHWTFAGQSAPRLLRGRPPARTTRQVTLTPSATGNKVFAGAGVAADGTGSSCSTRATCSRCSPRRRPAPPTRPT